MQRGASNPEGWAMGEATRRIDRAFAKADAHERKSIAYQVADVFLAMERAGGQSIPALEADGGGTQNDWLMQFQADILDREVVRGDLADASAIGAAWLAGLAAGVWKSLDELAALPRAEHRFQPGMKAGERERLYSQWREAIERATVER